MTSPGGAGFLDFFVLEAGEYVDQLDALLMQAGQSAPDAEGLQRLARALRGSATMARLQAFADLAAGMERTGRALRDQSVQWSDALRGVLISAVDDLKILLRNARTWTDADTVLARHRAAEIAAHVPISAPRVVTPTSGETQDSYLATESANVGAGLELLATRPADRDAASNVLRRVRALRGIASIKDYPSLAEVLEGAELTALPLEQGEGALTRERVAVLKAAGDVLREIAGGIRSGRHDTVTNLEAFNTALAALDDMDHGSDRILPISELFFAGEPDSVVERAPSPPTTPTERFRLEAVSHGEHLRRIVEEARGAADEAASERAKRALRHGLRNLGVVAHSYGEGEVRDYAHDMSERADALDAPALQQIDSVAALLAHPETGSGSIGARVVAMKNRRLSGATPSAANAAIAPASPTAQERVTPAVAAVAHAATTVTAAAPLNDLLSAGISSLGTLRKTPLSAPVAIDEQPPVPIDTLLFRGRAAIERCVEIRNHARESGRDMDHDALSEMFDLLDLALTN